MIAPAGAHYRPLGCFRFMLAMLVVVQHFQHLLPPAPRALFARMGFGAIAVCVFFAVSGFVVAEALAIFYIGRSGAFLINRALRLVPPYLAALVLSILIHGALWRAGRLMLWDYDLATSPLAPSVLLSGLLGLMPGFDPEWLGHDFEFLPYAWTLRLEILFYLCAAAAMAISWRLRARWPVAATIGLGLAAGPAYWLATRRAGALSTAPMFLVGVSLYLWDARRVWGRAVMLLVSVVLAAVGFAAWHQRGTPVLAWQLPVLGALMALFAVLVSRRAAGRFRRLDRRLGDLSYPLYLNHYVVGIMGSSLAGAPGVGLYGAAVCVAVALSVASEKLVDRPLRRLRDRVRTVTV